MQYLGGQDRVATRYRLDGPGMESRWKAIIPVLVKSGPSSHPVSVKWASDLFPGVKAA